MSDAAKEKLEKEQERMKKAGQDFEALFFSMMLKEMRNSISSEEGGGMFAGEGSDTYGGMFDTFIGQHMATSGQLGLAETVEIADCPALNDSQSERQTQATRRKMTDPKQPVSNCALANRMLNAQAQR